MQKTAALKQTNFLRSGVGTNASVLSRIVKNRKRTAWKRNHPCFKLQSKTAIEGGTIGAAEILKVRRERASGAGERVGGVPVTCQFGVCTRVYHAPFCFPLRPH